MTTDKTEHAKEVLNSDCECLNCGGDLPHVKEDLDECQDCCEHDNVRSELTGDYCEDCGAKVN